MRPRGRLREVVTYVAILAVGAVALIVVLPIGNDITEAPQGPAYGEVEGAGTACLGPRVALVQSGVFAHLYVPGRGGRSDEGLGPGIADGELDRRSGAVDLEGTCAPTSPRGGEPFTWPAHFVRQLEGPAVITGDLQVGGEELAARITPVAPSQAGTGTRPLEGSDLIGRIFLAVAVVITAARLMGSLFNRIRQPRVVGEIVAGILLGPSLVGIWFPGATRYLFPPEVTGLLGVLAQFGLVFFMFLIGLELDHRTLRASSHTAVLISHVSIVVPFALGVILSLVLYPVVGSGEFTGFALFMGAAMAITAFPVLARILTDTGLHRTRLGALAITCAAVDDITAWCILAVVVAVVQSTGGGEAAQTIVLALLFIVAMFAIVRPVLRRLATVYEARGSLNPPIMAAIIVGLLLSAWATEQIGIHAIFGAFLAGAIMPRSKPLASAITEKVEDMTVLFLLPIFFAVVGLTTRFNLLDRAELWLLAALTVAVAVAGKFGGSMVAARAAGHGWRYSTSLGVLMNARGLTEIVILSVGRSLGVISPALFTIMVMMALVTTFMATPLLAVLYPRHLIDRETRRLEVAEQLMERSAGYQRVMVAVGAPAAAEALVDVATHLQSLDGHRPTLLLGHIVTPPGREEVRANLSTWDDEAAVHRERLVPLERRAEEAGFATEVVTALGDPGTELPRLALDAGADLLIVSAHRPYVGQNPFGGVVGAVLSSAPTDVVVLSERSGTPRLGGPVAAWFEGSINDVAALELATLLASGHGTSVRVVSPPGAQPLEMAASVERVVVPDRELSVVLDALDGARLVVVGAAPDGSATGVRRQLFDGSPVPVLAIRARPTPSGGVPAPREERLYRSTPGAAVRSSTQRET